MNIMFIAITFSIVSSFILQIVYIYVSRMP